MLRIGTKNIENIEKWIIFGDASMTINGKTTEKLAPRFFIEGTYQDKIVRLMIEAFITEEEIYNLKLNKECNINELVTDVLFWDDFDNKDVFSDNTKFLVNEKWDIIIKRISATNFIVTITIPAIDLIFEDEVYRK